MLIVNLFTFNCYCCL